MSTRTVTIKVDDAVCIVTGDYMPGFAGVLSGPPDRWEAPEEAEFEIESLIVTLPTIDGGQVQIDLIELPDPSWLAGSFMERVRDGAILAIEREGDAPDEP